MSRARLAGLAQSYETIEFKITDRSKLWREIPESFSFPAEVLARGVVRFPDGAHPFTLDTRQRPTLGPWIVYEDATGATTRRTDGWGDRMFVWMDSRPITPNGDRLYVSIGDDASVQSIVYERAD